MDAFRSPALVVAGADGDLAQRTRQLARRLPRGELHELAGYTSHIWSDTLADRTEDAAGAIENFLARVDDANEASAVHIPESQGEVAGIHYTVRGQGTPLVLFPLSLAPSQWSPLLSRLADRHCVVLLGGAHLGAVAMLEARVAAGYGALVVETFGRASPRPGEKILDVGCGSGAIARRIAGLTNKANPIVAADLSPYLLSEARRLVEHAGLGGVIRFEDGDAEALPFADGQFDISLCSTVLEEGNADRMIAELARVTCAGGRIMTITRAVDVDWWANLVLPAELLKRINALGPATGAGAASEGCADASLYRRLRQMGLTPVFIGPQFAIYDRGDRLESVLSRLSAPLSGPDASRVQEAVELARRAKTLFVAEPFHCAVAVKNPSQD